MIKLRDYDPTKDKKAVYRIWRKVGWLEEGEKQQEVAGLAIGCSRARVAEIDGEAECLVITIPGVVRYLDQDLFFSCVRRASPCPTNSSGRWNS